MAVMMMPEEYDVHMADIMRMPPEERCNWTCTLHDSQGKGTPCKFDGKDILNYSDIAHKFVKVQRFDAEMLRGAVPNSSRGTASPRRSPSRSRGTSTASAMRLCSTTATLEARRRSHRSRPR